MSNPPMRLGPNNLLEFDSRYGVLICRECHYAIQKSALQSHLLRHKIYREERQQLLTAIAQLDLLEPEDVLLPSPDSLPIDSLPILDGFRCTALGCGNLCASSKRMKRHRSEAHGLSEPCDPSFFSRPVKIQTFFRGTKLRYFEVTPLHTQGNSMTALPLTTATTEGIDDDEQDGDLDEPAEQAQDSQMQDVPLSSSSEIPLNLETMTYFHHFTSVTSLTIPGIKRLQDSPQYWQTEVVHYALQRQWMMCGLLAVSACHLASLTDDPDLELVHGQRAISFAGEFLAGLENTYSHGLPVEVRQACTQIRSILRCAQGTALDPAAPSPLHSFMEVIRDFIIPEYDTDENGLFRAACPMMNMMPCDASEALRRSLESLPARMTDAFGRPSNTREPLTIMSAVMALHGCVAITFGCGENDQGPAWVGMISWVSKVPETYRQMVANHHAAALVVLAHWAAGLVGRAENCGWWFLKGSAATIMSMIEERLPPEDYAVRGLIAGLQQAETEWTAVR